MKKNVFYAIIIAITLVLTAITLLSSCGSNVSENQDFALYVKKNVEENAKGAVFDERYTPSKKEAILLIPGVLGSALYSPYDEDGQSSTYWSLDTSSVMSTISSAGKIKSNAIKGLVADKDCNVEVALRPGNMTDESAYDAYNSMKDLYFSLSEKYSENYDIICWQYDWRLHLDVAAINLERFINQCEYEKVVLITHSMGGLVASRYLIKQENRDKVKLFVPVGTPFLGALEANAIIADSVSSARSPGLLGMVDIDQVASLIDKRLSIKLSVRNLYSAYHLFALGALWQTSPYGDINTPIAIDGKNVTMTQYLDMVKSLEWSKGEDGNTKFAIDTLEYFHSQYFVEGKHVSTLVNTCYVVGTGTSTVSKICFSDKGVVRSYEASMEGDGLVLLPSATAAVGSKEDEASKNIIIVNGTHLEICNSENVALALDKMGLK